MNRVLAYLGRFAVIILGYIAASLAASGFLNMLSFGSLGFMAGEAPWVMGSIVFSIPFIALFVAYFAFVPSVAAILLAEILGARDWLYYAIVGGLVGAAAVALSWYSSTPRNDFGEFDSGLFLAVVGSGLVGGIAYWAVAVRLAGNWRGRSNEDPTSPERPES